MCRIRCIKNRLLVTILAETSDTVDYRNIVDLDDLRSRARDDAEMHLGHDISFLVWFRGNGHVARTTCARIYTWLRTVVVAIYHDVNVIDNFRLLNCAIL